ncbi:FAD-dependent oxidoreductase [Candidatus Daviesbacteria bacterium]|nr:FAD-dependent oxidoreductase [Candidatus Daviesbacteria bacterium]
MKLTLVNKKPEVANVESFLFKPEIDLTWQAGQFFRYHLEDLNPDTRKTNRYFTIASAPFEKLIMITTRFVPGDGSTFKKDLLNLKIGDSLEASGPSGDFVVEDPSEQSSSSNKNFIFIAGGIGITPFRSIILDLNHNQKPINIKLLYANRTPDFIFKSELESVQKKHPEFKIEYYVDPLRIDEKAIQLAINNYKQSLPFARAKRNLPMIYVSGPEPMVEAFGETLTKMGVAKNQIKQDFFPGYTAP